MLSASVIRPEKGILFPEIDQVKIFLSLTHPHSQMCIRIHIFLISKNKQTSKIKTRTQKKQKKQKKKRDYLWKID